MQNDFRSELYISTCPRCGTRLMCGKDHRHRFAKNVPSATGTGSSRWKRTKYPSQGHPSILRSLPETHSN